MRVPGAVRRAETESRGQRVGDRQPVRPERRQRASRPAELQHQRVLERRGHAASCPVERVGPSRRFQPERDRRRLLQPGPTGHRGIGVAPRLTCGGTLRAREVVEDGRYGRAELQDEARVQDILTRRAPVDVARRVGVDRGNPRGQVADHGDDDVAGVHRVGGDDRTIVQLGFRGRLDGGNAGGRYHPGRRLGVGERRLDVQHHLELGVVCELRRDRRLAKQAVVQSSARTHEASHIEKHRFVWSLQHDLESVARPRAGTRIAKKGPTVCEGVSGSIC